MKPEKKFYEIRASLEDKEKSQKGWLFNYIQSGIADGTVTISEIRQAGLIAKDLIFNDYKWSISLENVHKDNEPTYEEYLLRLIMAALLPKAQALATLCGDYWNINREMLERACKHAGRYHHYLYDIVEEQWQLRVCPPVWTTADIRQLRKKALSEYKHSPSVGTARMVAISLLPPSEAQILCRTDEQPLTFAQLRTAISRAPSPTYKKAVEFYEQKAF